MIDQQTAARYRSRLEALYNKYNSRVWVPPDPLEFLYRYEHPGDREVVGLISSSLAYGRVRQIHRSISFVLERMGRPRSYLRKATRRSLARDLQGFKHRFTTAEELGLLLFGIKKAVRRFGSLEACFADGMRPGPESTRMGGDGLRRGAECLLPAMERFVEKVFPRTAGARFSLLPHPDRGSACKRLNLYLRWMVRQDGVDPGGWSRVDPAQLIVPLDTHLHRIALSLGLTGRAQGDLRTALEVTAAFKAISPQDPVRYDFALTRLGIRSDADPVAFLAGFGRRGTASSS